MKKAFINKICSKFNFEVNGLSYMQALRKAAITPNIFLKQKELLNGKAQVIFDLGANNGSVAMEYKEIFQNSMIYCFEPFPEMFKILSENTATHKEVNVFKKAISDKSGKRTFYINESVDTNSLLESQPTGMRSDVQVKNRSKIEVETTSLDEFCGENSIPQIDILKMDIQGSELDALKGAAQLIKSKKVGLIYTEIYFVAQYANQPLFQDILTYLYQEEYHLQDIYNPIYGNGSIAWCDAIFLPR